MTDNSIRRHWVAIQDLQDRITKLETSNAILLDWVVELQNALEGIHDDAVLAPNIPAKKRGRPRKNQPV